MKQKILFVMNNLQCGGAEKALISLLETIDYSLYEVDLYLLRHSGIFMSKIPAAVKLLGEPQEYQYYDMPIRKAVLNCLKRGRINIASFRLRAGVIYKTEKNSVRCEQRVWKYLSKSLKSIDQVYDIAIGYLEKNPIYFCIDKVKARKKIGFIHNDYDRLGMDPSYDKTYFDKLDHLVTVSGECGTILKKRFPKYAHKVEVMHNIVSPAAIRNLAMEDADWNAANTIPDSPVGQTPPIKKDSAIKLVSIGRLNYQKGFEMAVQTCKELVEGGYPVQWYVIGEGEERKTLERMISENGLQDRFHLLGVKENPYPYIREADIYVQPSRFEGKSIAIDEAKILHKPIVVTNFSTAKDQITDRHNGLIVEMDARSIAQGIKALLEDASLRRQLSVNLEKEPLGTETEIEKLYALFA